MQAHKMLLGEVEEDSFWLAAIYTNVESFKLAFLINKHLGLRLKREKADVDYSHKNLKAFYERFTFNDPTNSHIYNLVANKYKGRPQKILSSGSLFEEELRPQVVNLVPEYEKVNFFLKVEEDMPGHLFTKLVNRISQMPRVIAVHPVDVDRLKSKQNLIFE